MKIHFIHPFSLDKKYGKELNETFALIPDSDWVCVMDWDCMLLAAEQVKEMYKYVERFPGAGMFVALSGRSGSAGQRIAGQFSMADEMVLQHEKATKILQQEFDVTGLDEKISGYLMLISKRTWNEIKFNEDLQVLHVDRDYARQLLLNNKDILLMNTIYVWHSYRIWKPVKDISHLT